MNFLGVRLNGSRNRNLLDVAAGLELLGLHMERVDEAHELAVLDDRNLYGNAGVAESFLDFREDLVEIDGLIVHLVEKNGAGNAPLACQFPALLGTDGNSAGKNDDRRVRDGNTLKNFTYKIERSGSVNNVDHFLLPLTRRNCEIYRILPLDLLGVVVKRCITVHNLSETADRLTVVKHRLCHGCLTDTAVSQKNNVANIRALHKTKPPNFNDNRS